jgi:hypothetical protein
MERDRIAWLVRFRLIKANEIHDLAAILTALKRIGLIPTRQLLKQMKWSF